MLYDESTDAFEKEKGPDFSSPFSFIVLGGAMGLGYRLSSQAL